MANQSLIVLSYQNLKHSLLFQNSSEVAKILINAKLKFCWQTNLTAGAINVNSEIRVSQSLEKCENEKF